MHWKRNCTFSVSHNKTIINTDKSYSQVRPLAAIQIYNGASATGEKKEKKSEKCKKLKKAFKITENC